MWLLGLLAVIVLQLSRHVQTADNGDEFLKQLEQEQDVPYLLEVNIIRIHMPLSWWNRWNKPCPVTNPENDVKLMSHVWKKWKKNYTSGDDDKHIWGKWKKNNMTDTDDTHDWAMRRNNMTTDDDEDDNDDNGAWGEWSKNMSDSDGWAGMSDALSQDFTSSPTEVPRERMRWHSHKSTGTPTAATAPEQFTHPATKSYPRNEILVPDAAALDVLFTNGSRLNDSIDAFGFAGTYSVRVTRSSRDVQVVLVLLSPELDALPSEEVRLSVSGPTVVGLQGSGAEDGDSPGKMTLDRLAHRPLQTSVWKRRQDKWWKRDWPGDQQPIYINGSALTGDQLCGLSFNVSGVFMLNKSMTADTTTVVIAQLIATGDSAQQALHVFEGATAAGDSSSGPRLLGLITVSGALLTLLAAVAVWRVTRRRASSLVRFSQSYGTMQRPLDAAGYYDGSEGYP